MRRLSRPTRIWTKRRRKRRTSLLQARLNDLHDHLHVDLQDEVLPLLLVGVRIPHLYPAERAQLHPVLGPLCSLRELRVAVQALCAVDSPVLSTVERLARSMVEPQARQVLLELQAHPHLSEVQLPPPLAKPVPSHPHPHQLPLVRNKASGKPPPNHHSRKTLPPLPLPNGDRPQVLQHPIEIVKRRNPLRPLRLRLNLRSSRSLE